MRSRFLLYLIAVTLVGSFSTWGSMLGNAAGGRGTGNSWYSHSWFGGGYGGGYSGGFAGAAGGGHK
jgi:hypothetical protein